MATSTDDFRPWSLSAREVVAKLGSDAIGGLTSAEARRRLNEYGRNVIPDPPPDPLWKRYWGQLTGDAVVRLLLVGGIVSLLLADYLEGVAIIIMLNIMAWFGLWQEGRATDAARSLRSRDINKKKVVRDGKQGELLAEEIVVGDILFLNKGDIVPADGRILVATRETEIDRAKLTGESIPVMVENAPVAPSAEIVDRSCMVYRGYKLMAGTLTMVVTQTGSATELGKIAIILSESDDSTTPLDEQLDNLGDTMAKVFIWIAVVVIGFGLVGDLYRQWQTASVLDPWQILNIFKEGFINAVALIIAAIPEGLPAVLTISLAIAGTTLAERKAMVRRPKAVEGGGSMTILLTDKTGTLTANEMTVTQLFLGGKLMRADQIRPETERDSTVVRAMQIAQQCNNNADPTESALLRWVEKAGFVAVGDASSRVVEHGFDQSLKRMTTIYPNIEMGGYRIYTKGAPEHVLKLCRKIHLNGEDVLLTEAHRATILRTMKELASQALRVISLADRVHQNGHELSRQEAEDDLVFVGLLGIMDPARPDVAPAVEILKAAGIRTVMVTGDNEVTAYYVAKSVNIIEGEPSIEEAVIFGEELDELRAGNEEDRRRLQSVRAFARVSPMHKAEIVELMQESGYIVGMTGDGVNDAIALRRSDVGFAMGNGTEVAIEAADVVLTNSLFSTIPVAVEEGRNVLYRIRLYLSYILSGNGCEVGVFILAYLLGLPIPLTALVLLIINFATDSFPALAMTFEQGEEAVMRRKPRTRDEPFITRPMWVHIIVQTVVATVIIMGVYYYCVVMLGTSLEVARAAAFMAYISQKLYRAFTARSLTRNLWQIGLFRNRWTIGAVLISLAIALFFVYVPGVNQAMGLAPLGTSLVLMIAAVGLIPPFVEEITKLFLRPASGNEQQAPSRRSVSSLSPS